MSKPALTPAQRAALAQRLKHAGNLAADTILRRAPDTAVPLSGLQSTLWLVDQLNPGTVAYNQLAGFTVTGPLDSGALAEAFRTVVQRHEALHSTAELSPAGIPIAIPRPHQQAAVYDNVCTIADRDNELRRIARASFDLANDLPIRLIVLRHDVAHATVGISAHHIGLDNFSAAIVVSELTEIYGALVGHISKPLPPVEVRYGDFSVWQHARLDGARGTELRAYWADELRNVEPTLELPLDRVRPERQAFDGERVAVDVSAPITQELLNSARSFGVTPYMFCFCAFAALLHRWSGQSTFAVGTPIAGRDRAELESMVGFLNNTLIISFDFTQPQTWHSLLTTTRTQLVRAFAHSELPVDQVVEVVNPPRLADRNPLFQTNFRLAPPTTQPIDTGGTHWERLPFDLQYSKFDLALELHLVARGTEPAVLNGHVEYNSALFHRDTAQRVSQFYIELLDRVIKMPETDILAIPALSTRSERPRSGPARRPPPLHP